MERSIFVFACLAGILVSGFCASLCAEVDDRVAKGKEFVERLAEEKFVEAEEYFDDTMKGALPVEKLREIWKAQIGVLGAFEKIEGTKTESIEEYLVVYVTCRFKNQTLAIKAVFNKESKIAGMFFVPAQ